MSEEHRYLQSRDGTKLHAVITSASGEPRGQVVIVHGLAEHMGRYAHVAAALAEAGWRVIGLELRGHGDSEGKRGHVERWGSYAEDLALAMELADGPCVLLGHSMGGLVVLDALLDNPDAAVAGIVLTNPLLGVRVKAPAWKLALAGFLSRVLPRVSLDNELDTDKISRDKDVVEAYVADPKVYRGITPRWYVEMLAAMERVQTAAASYRTPLLMVTSDADGICDPPAAREFMTRYGSGGEEKRYDELYHEVLNEPEKEQVMGDILAWLQAL